MTPFTRSIKHCRVIAPGMECFDGAKSGQKHSPHSPHSPIPDGEVGNEGNVGKDFP